MLAPILEMTVYMTVTAVILLLFKRVFKNKLSAKWQVWIWVLLLVRLIAPILPQSGFSIFNAVNMNIIGYEAQKAEDTLAEVKWQPSPTAEDELFGDQWASVYVNLERNTPEERKGIDIDKIGIIIWLSGMAAFLLYFLIGYMACIYKAKSCRASDNPALKQILDDCCETVGIKQKIKLVVGDGFTPMLMGIFRPKILICDGFSDKEYRDIITHELCHLKNGDIFVIWIAMAVLCVNWFNPVMWYSFFVLRRDIEVYCDSRAVEYVENKKEYAELLLKTALRKNRFIAGTTALQNGEKEVERRIKYMAYFKKPKVLWSVVLGLLAGFISALCLTNSFASCEMSGERKDEFKNRLVGSVMAQLAYADGEKVVFYYLDGLFVYSIPEEKLVREYDISKLNCETHHQGSSGLDITVTDDGKYAYLINYGLRDEIEDFDNYIINLDTGRVKTTEILKPENPFKGFGDAFTLENTRGWFSNQYAETKQSIVYLTVRASRIEHLEIVIRDKASGKQRELYPFEEELNNTVLFSPADIRNIISARLVTTEGEAYVLEEKSRLKRLEALLGDAQKTGSSGCPFDAVLIISREDGTKGRVNLATDSCCQLVGKNNEYFRYDESNSVFLTLFGLSDWPQHANDGSFYSRVKSYMFDAFTKRYSPHYEILDLCITHWEEISPTEARFSYKMIHKNFDKDPDTVPYIKEAKERGEYIYETYKKEYLEPKTGTYDLKAVDENGELVLYANLAGKGEMWQRFDPKTIVNPMTSFVPREDDRTFEWPCPGIYDISRYFTGEYNHAGVDIKGEKGAPVVAATDGRVTKAEYQKELGNYIEISDGAGIVTRYAHLDEMNVEVGDEVKRNVVIGKVGQTGLATGPHLHFEIRINGTMIDPMMYF